MGCKEEPNWRRLAVPRQLGQSEVQDLGLTALGDEKIGRFDVAVNDAFGVRGVERVRDFHRQVQQLLDRQRPGFNNVLEGLALHQLHGDERLPVVLADLMDGADVGMVEGGSSPGFAAEALQRLGILRQVFGEKLQSNVAAQAEVLGLIDHTHPATAQLREDFVMGNCASNHSGPLYREWFILLHAANRPGEK